MGSSQSREAGASRRDGAASSLPSAAASTTTSTSTTSLPPRETSLSSANQPPSPSPPPSYALQPPPKPGYNRNVHMVSLILVIVSPLAMLLPPRPKSVLDLRQLALGGVTAVSADRLVRDYTGEPDRSLWDRVRGAREAAAGGQAAAAAEGTGEGGPGEEMGKDAQERWYAERARRDNEALAQGRGYGDLILEQVREVWGQLRGGKGEGKDDPSSGGSSGKKD